ncbi:MAG: hypothetical protein ACFCUL_13315 [Flavobacteriaceae bacterium]
MKLQQALFEVLAYLLQGSSKRPLPITTEPIPADAEVTSRARRTM